MATPTTSNIQMKIKTSKIEKENASGSNHLTVGRSVSINIGKKFLQIIKNHFSKKKAA